MRKEMKKDKMIYEKAHNSAEHYNLMIWTVFSIAVALSLYILYLIWPAKSNLGAMQFFMAFLGFLILFYGTLTIESFSQKNFLLYKIFNSGIKKFNLESKIKKLPFVRVEWIAEIILLMVISAYVFFFWFVWRNKSLATFGKTITFFDLPILIISLALSLIVIINWIRRPKNDRGNTIEKIRKFLFGDCLKSYDEIMGLKNETTNTNQ